MSSTAIATKESTNAPTSESAMLRQATDVAGLCREIVLKTVIEIGDRKYVPVEAWMTIAVAHNCIATIRSVDFGPEGCRAVAEIRRQSDGAILTSAEGFVGADEPVWFGGPDTVWDKIARTEREVIRKKRPNYAIRAMAQTRAVSRACRTAFSHVVVLMNAGLSTTPYEEIAPGAEVEDDIPMGEKKKNERPAEQAGKPGPETDKPADGKIEVPRDADVALRKQFEDGSWRKVKIHFGQRKGDELGALEEKDLRWWCFDWKGPQLFRGKYNDDDVLLKAALGAAAAEIFPDHK